MADHIAEIRSALESAVLKAISAGHAGILFSGGLDSSVLAAIAKKRNPSTILYVAGIDGSGDLKAARENAARLGMKLVEVVLDDEALLQLLEKTREITGERELMKLELGIVLLACCMKAREDGVGLLLSGLGAEELFLGYHAHLKSYAAGDDLEALRKKELDGLYEKDIRRSEMIASHCNVKLALPFLDEGVVKAVLSVPAKENFKNGENKAVLRAVARRMRLHESICAKRKKAMQYGSGVHGRLIRILRKKQNQYKNWEVKTDLYAAQKACGR